MKTNLFFAGPAEVETECLAVVVLDRGEKDKTEVSVESDDSQCRHPRREISPIFSSKQSMTARN